MKIEIEFVSKIVGHDIVTIEQLYDDWCNRSSRSSSGNNIIDRIKIAIPDNPYPKDIFPMTTEDYVKAIPDPILRTAVSGCIGRWAFDMARRYILEKLIEEFEE